MWQPGWEGSLGENGYMYMYGSVPSCPPENITTLLKDYTPIYNKKFKKKKHGFSQQSLVDISRRFRWLGLDISRKGGFNLGQ